MLDERKIANGFWTKLEPEVSPALPLSFRTKLSDTKNRTIIPAQVKKPRAKTPKLAGSAP
jgi:hypothetical protein